MTKVSLIGIAPSMLTGTSLVPQLWRIIKTRKPCDISYVTLAILFAGLGLWVCYGVLKQDPIIVAANAFPMLMCICIVALNFKYKS